MDHLPNCYSARPSPFFLYRCCYISTDWTFTKHLSHALPTDMIFYVLRSIPSDRLIRIEAEKSMLDALEIILNWLQVSVSVNDCNRQTLQIKFRFVSRDLVLSDQAICTIASRVNFKLNGVDTKLHLVMICGPQAAGTQSSINLKYLMTRKYSGCSLMA